MRLALASLFLMSSLAFAADETVTVEAPRLPPASPSSGTSASGTSGGADAGGIGRPRPCSDPTCGGLIDPKEPGTGGDTITTDAKNANNKSTLDKIKKVGETAIEALKKTSDIIATIKKFFGLDFSTTQYSERAVILPDGNVAFGPDGKPVMERDCKDVALGTNSKDSPCVKILTNNQQVRLKSGELQNQVAVQYTILDACYYTQKCGLKSFTLIAATEAELNRLLNLAIGENYF